MIARASLLALLLPLGCVALPAAVAAKDDAKAASQTAEQADADKIKCRSVYDVGSRIPKRVCRTNEEWARIEEDNRQTLENGRRSGGQNAESGTIYSS